MSTAGPCLSLACLALGALLLAPAARAQSPRDPTVAPAPAAAPGALGETRARAPEPEPMAVIVRDGQPYLVVGTRLLAQGQKLGEARIERITETEIWLREGRQLRKIQRYPGVRRGPATGIQTQMGKP